MSSTEKLNKILKRCKCGVYLNVNAHRDYYETVRDSINEKIQLDSIEEGDIDKEVLDKMIELDTIIDLQFYPDTPIGSYSIYHYDLEKALDMAIDVLKINK